MKLDSRVYVFLAIIFYSGLFFQFSALVNQIVIFFMLCYSCYRIANEKYNIYFYIICFLIIFFLSLLMFINNVFLWKEKVLFLISFVALATYSSLFTKVNLKLESLCVLIYIYLSVFFVFVYRGYDGNSIFYNASRNIVTAVLLYQTISYQVFSYMDSKKEHMQRVVASILLLMAVLVIGGRAALISSFLLFLVNIISVKRKQYLIVFLLFISTIVTVSAINHEMIFTLLANNYFEEGLKSTRTVIYDEYFSGFSWMVFLFGGDIYDLDIISKLNYNLHNSYLQCHMLFGLVGVGVAIAISIFSVKHVHRVIGLYGACVICIVFFRAMTDKLLFFGFLDTVYLVPVFICFNMSNKSGVMNE